MLSLYRVGPIAGLFLLGAGLLTGPPRVVGDEPARQPLTLALFDGRTLDGWKAITGVKVGTVSVANDSLVLSAGEPMNGVTSTRTDLPTTDYAFSYEAKRTSGNDFFAAATFPVGKSFVTLVNGGWGGSVTGLSLINGASALENETNHFVKYPNDVWFAFEVQVTARVIRCLIDGKEIFAFDHEDVPLKTRLETRVSQPLGFATYRSSSEIRKVNLRQLSPEEVVAVDARIKRD